VNEMVNVDRHIESLFASTPVAPHGCSREKAIPIIQDNLVWLITYMHDDFVLHLAQCKHEPMNCIGSAAYYLLVSAFIVLYAEFGLYLHPQWVSLVSLSARVLMVSGTGLSALSEFPRNSGFAIAITDYRG